MPENRIEKFFRPEGEPEGSLQQQPRAQVEMFFKETCPQCGTIVSTFSLRPMSADRLDSPSITREELVERSMGEGLLSIANNIALGRECPKCSYKMKV